MLQSSQQRIYAISFSEAIKDQVPSQMKDECECMICSCSYNLQSRVPMNICGSQHHCCLVCVNKILATRNQCPFCKQVINKKLVQKNRIICKILQDAAKRTGITYKVNQNPEIKILSQQVINPINYSQNREPLLPQFIQPIINNHRRNPQIRTQQTNRLPWIEKFSTKINQRLYHGETTLIFFNIIVFFIFALIEINYSSYYNIQFNYQCCGYYDNCSKIDSRIKSSCSADAISSFYIIAAMLIVYVCKKNAKKYAQTYMLLFLLSYLALTVKYIYYCVIQKLDFYDLESVFYIYPHSQTLSACMGAYYTYFGYFIYVTGSWAGLCLLYVACRFVANQ